MDAGVSESLAKLTSVGGLALLFSLLLGWVAAAVARRSPGPGSPGRKLFHAGIFTGAVPAQLLGGFEGVIVYGTVVAVVVASAILLGERFFLHRGLIRVTDGPRTRRYLLLPLVSTAAGGLASVLLVGSYAVVGYLVCGWGDAAGELVGSRHGRRRYRLPWGQEGSGSRSLEGSAAVLVLGCLGAWAALGLLGAGAGSSLWVGLLCGGVGAMAEGVSSHGTDNLWVQIIPSLLAWGLLG